MLEKFKVHYAKFYIIVLNISDIMKVQVVAAAKYFSFKFNKKIFTYIQYNKRVSGVKFAIVTFRINHRFKILKI